MSKKYGLVAINDEQDHCTICGKVQLKRVMWLAELDIDGNIIDDAFNCGTTCGAKLLKVSTSKLNTKVKNAQAQIDRQREWLQSQHPAQKKADEIITRWNEQGLTFLQRKATPEYIERTTLCNEAREWAEAQEIVARL